MKNNLALFIGLSLPILFILIIGAIIYIPKLSIDPTYSFIYSADTSYNYNIAYKNTFKVVEGKVALDQTPKIDSDYYKNLSIKEYPTLYIYKIEDQTSQEITLEEAQEYDLDPGPASPDGYTIRYDYGHDGIFEIFGSDGQSNLLITKGSASKKLSGIMADNRYYSNGFQLVGWIK